MSDQIPEVDQTKLSRRTFLKLGGLSLGAAVADYILAHELLIPWLMEKPKVEVNPGVIAREKQDDLNLGPTRGEYFTLWPYSRVWVVVNNLLAVQKLDGFTLKKDREYSLIDLLGLHQSYGNNLNPDNGYIAGVCPTSEFPYTALAEAQGLSLTANVIARACALSPCRIIEWNTHSYLDEVTFEYFEPDDQYVSHPAYTQLGTDATVFTAGTVIKDFRFSPLTDLSLRYKIMDTDGKIINLPSLAKTLGSYPPSATKRFTQPLLVRAAFGGCKEQPQVGFKYLEREYGQVVRPGFQRSVTFKGRQISEKIWARYDTTGKTLPPL